MAKHYVSGTVLGDTLQLYRSHEDESLSLTPIPSGCTGVTLKIKSDQAGRYCEPPVSDSELTALGIFTS